MTKSLFSTPRSPPLSSRGAKGDVVVQRMCQGSLYYLHCLGASWIYNKMHKNIVIHSSVYASEREEILNERTNYNPSLEISRQVPIKLASNHISVMSMTCYMTITM